MTTFNKYNSIEGPQTGAGQRMVEWYGNKQVLITEKLHGANFSISGHSDSTELTFSKRSGPIPNDENFYMYWTIRDELAKASIAFSQNVVGKFEIFGELCGGGYPGIKSDVQTVQKGIWYSPRLEFFVFDVRVNDQYVNFADVLSSLHGAGFKIVPILGRCTLSEALDWKIRVSSRVPSQLGLPELPNNIIEGIVAKCEPPVYLPNGKRVILKIKNTEFGERQRVSKMKKPTIVLNAEAEQTYNTMLEYLCDARLDAVVSKVGPDCNPGKLIGMFVKDAWDAFANEGNKASYGSPSESGAQKKLVSGELMKAARELVIARN